MTRRAEAEKKTVLQKCSIIIVPRTIFPGAPPQPAPPPRKGFVYFVKTGDFVKIGFARSVAHRMNGLRTGSPHDLTLLHTEPGTIADEQALHRRFEQYRGRGEWFRLEGDLAAFLDDKKRTGNA